MTYLGYWRKPPPRPKPAHVPPAEALLARETFADRPFGSFGAMLPVPAAPPPQPPPKPVIPPPPWQDQLEAGDLDLASVAPPEPARQLSAFEAMSPEPPPWTATQEFVLPCPPTEPLRRFVPPEPDWRREEIERARRDRKQPVMDEPSKSLSRWPA